jgi:hypothetical protein
VAVLTWQDVVGLARELPESTSYGRPALKVRGKFVAAMRTNPDALVLRCDLDEKPLLLEARPDILFETPHYHGWGYVLLRLEASREEAQEFLTDSWLLAAPKRLADLISLD